MPSRTARPNTGAGARPQGPPAPAQHRSEDDPRVMLERDINADMYEPIPPYPTRTEREGEFYSLGDGEMFLNVGPHHPATHGVLRLVLKLSGEQIVDVDPVLGYLHRGVEKICENSDYYHVIDQVDPLEYVSSLFQEWAAVLSFEKLMDVQVPRRAEYIRVLSGELLRIASHTLFMGFLALDLGGLTPILYSFIERDEIVEMLAALTGARMLFNYFRIGGVNGDLNHEFMSRLGDWMTRAAQQTEASAGLLNENEIFVRRMRGVGVMDRAMALRYGVTGGNLRASGVPFDVRRAHPYSVYPELEFNIPTRDEATRWPATSFGSTRSASRSRSSTSASTTCPTARSWPGCRGCSGRAPGAPGEHAKDRAGCSVSTPSATAPTSRSASASTTPASSTSRPCRRCCRATCWPIRWP